MESDKSNWSERINSDGYIYYVNEVDNVTQWTHPETGKLKKVPLNVLHKDKIKISKKVDQEDIKYMVERSLPEPNKIKRLFNNSTTALQILHGIDLSGKVALITGANAGIGFETAKSLALHGCLVIMGCRNENLTKKAIETIAIDNLFAAKNCKYINLDLSSLEGTRIFADNVKKLVNHIDYLILNAGVYLPYQKTVDNVEGTFQISHLSHFYLTLLLENYLDHNSRVITLSSFLHKYTYFPRNLTEEFLSPSANNYWTFLAYNNAKLCNILFIRELAKKWKHKGISTFAVHPGTFVLSGIVRHSLLTTIFFSALVPFTKTLEQAASTTVYCAVSNELIGLSGLYYDNCYVAEPSVYARNDNLAKQLWDISCNMIERILKNN